MAKEAETDKEALIREAEKNKGKAVEQIKEAFLGYVKM